jgi:hypothetical protein
VHRLHIFQYSHCVLLVLGTKTWVKPSKFAVSLFCFITKLNQFPCLLHIESRCGNNTVLLWSTPFRAFSYIRYIFNYTDYKYTFLLHICTIYHVSMYLTPSSGRTCVFLTQKHLLLRSCYLWCIGCVIKYKRYNVVGLQ